MDHAGSLVDDLGPAPETERRVRSIRLHDPRIAPALAQALDPRLQVRLLLLCDVILSVLAEVPQFARSENALSDCAPSRALQLRELSLKRDESTPCDWLAVRHRRLHVVTPDSA